MVLSPSVGNRVKKEGSEIGEDHTIKESIYNVTRMELNGGMEELETTQVHRRW